jgi:hypothetical protein
MAASGDVSQIMLQMSNEAAQLVVDPLFWRGVLCFEGGVRGDVLRRFFGPKYFFRKHIKAGEKQEGVNMRLHTRARSRLKENSLSNGALRCLFMSSPFDQVQLFDGVLSSLVGCLPLSMALGFSILEQGRRCEVIDECASGFAGHPRGLFY